MDALFNWFRGHIHGELATVNGAPMLFIMAVALASAVMFFLIRAHFKQEISALKATVGHKQSLLDEYRDRLKGQTPIEVAKEITNLKDTITTLQNQVNRPQRRISSDQIDTFKSEIAKCRENNLFPQNWRMSISTTPDTETARFGVQIWKLFQDISCPCLFNAVGIHGEGERGIIFYTPKDVDRDANLQAVADIFEKMGLKFIWTQDPGSPAGQYLFIAPDAD